MLAIQNNLQNKINEPENEEDLLLDPVTKE